jgi:FixJ family two-component response regulator
MGHKRVVHVIDDESDVCEALKVLLHTAGMTRTYASAEGSSRNSS